jgi:hypothetical protein
MSLVLMSSTCDNCGAPEERVFRDSWTGIELCCCCVHDVIGNVTMSPASDGDNLEKLLDAGKEA